MANYFWALFGAAIGATILSRGLRRGRLAWMGRTLTRREAPVSYWIVLMLAAVLVVHGAWYLANGWG